VFGSKISTFLFAIKTCLKELKNEVLILISGKFLHLESFSLLNYEANLLIRLFIHIPPEIHLIFIFFHEHTSYKHYAPTFYTF
jgi:hypothetical protein